MAANRHPELSSMLRDGSVFMKAARVPLVFIAQNCVWPVVPLCQITFFRALTSSPSVTSPTGIHPELSAVFRLLSKFKNDTRVAPFMLHAWVAPVVPICQSRSGKESVLKLTFTRFEAT